MATELTYRREAVCSRAEAPAAPFETRALDGQARALHAFAQVQLFVMSYGRLREGGLRRDSR